MQCTGQQPPDQADAADISGSSPVSSTAVLTNVQPLTSADLDVGHIDAAQPPARAAHSSQPEAAKAAAAVSEAQLDQDGTSPTVADADPKVLHCHSAVTSFRCQLYLSTATTLGSYPS